jgi:Cft2 family RNA processing exonuclease
MNSELLKKIGIDNIDPAYFIIGLLIICIGLLIYIIYTNKKIAKLTDKYKKFMSGKDGKSLENVVEKRFSQVDDLIECDKITNNKIEEINENLLTTFQKVGIVKYDAFNEMGGKLSFALALLNKENTGFVINAMHSREGCYTYIKEIIKGESYILLGEEESEAVDKAVNCDNYME